MALAYYSFIVATWGAIFSTAAGATLRHQKQLEDVSAYLWFRSELPTAVQRRLNEYHSFLWDSQKGVPTIEFLDDFPPSLRADLVLAQA
eukprot:3875719-Prymnesium_polylepis.1